MSSHFLLLYFAGDDKHIELPMKKNSDICTILYTTGTIGDPKGVLIFNNSIAYIVAAANRFLQGVPEHNVKLLVEDIGVLKPTVLCAVPRILDIIHSVMPNPLKHQSNRTHNVEYHAIHSEHLDYQIQYSPIHPLTPLTHLMFLKAQYPIYSMSQLIAE
ncbi:hypothetical protein DCAR_0312590 [Daucus carota subsp. sativus]|uniref:4-coumarate--CoA ligase n=1 Tax=Daucus carota subsp. sativus TaxID=79200 RepID=A0AAF0WQ79_DAUCS|nr:hypothetical protein DCAR_0312590 [Daucus carota subsp. sativus]